MHVALLGSPLASHGGVELRVEGAKTRSLLALLALRRGQTVSLDRLGEELWNGAPPPSVEGTLHAYVSRLRRGLGAHARVVSTVRPGYRLDLGPDEVDAARFEALHGRARSTLAAGRPQEASALWVRALDLWRGDPRDSIAGFASAEHEVGRLEELRLEAREGLFGARLAWGEAGEVVADLQTLVRLHPGRERLWCLLVTALHREGRQVESLAAYGSARAFLLDEFGVEPGPELRAAQAAVLAQEGPPAPQAGSRRPLLPDTVPPALRGRSTGSDPVGRSAELEALRRWWSSGGPNRLALVRGDAGIGKTRLAEELALEVVDQGAFVLWARCLEQGGSPYAPLVVALRDHLVGLAPHLRPVPAGRGGRLLARLLPALGVPAEPVSGSTIFDRFEMFEAAAALVHDLAADRDVLLVVDDLDQADASSLELLHHLLRFPGRLLVLATARPTAHEAPSERLVSALRHDDLVSEMPVSSLTPADSQAFLEQVVGGALPPGLVDALVRETAGNPYRLREAGRTLREEPALTRELRSTPGVLEAAAVIGQEFDSALLVTVLEQPVAAVSAVLETAVRAGVLVAGPWDDAIAGRYRFTHALTRDAVEEAVAPGRRSRLHRRIGEVLAAARPGSGPPSEVVRHLTASASADAALAADFAVRAARDAAAVLGYAEAAGHYRTALGLLELAAPDDRLRRCHLLLAEGEALLAAYTIGSSRSAFLRAAELALGLGLGAEAEVSRAVTGLVAGTEFGVVDAEAHELLLAAAAVADREGWTDATRALVEAGRARLLPPDDPERAVLARRAEVLVGGCSDEGVRAFVLGTLLLVDWRPDNLAWRRATVDEALGLAERAGLAELWLELVNLASAVSEEEGEPEAAQAAVQALVDGAERSRRPFFLALARMRQASAYLRVGDYGSASRASTSMLDSGGTSPNFAAARLAHAVVGGRDRGELEGVVPGLRQAVALTGRAEWVAALALALLELGEAAEGRLLYDRLAVDGFGTVPLDWLWLSTTCYLGECATLLGDAEGARTLREALVPFRHREVVVAHGVLSLGAAARVCGMLAATAGRLDDAYADLEVALDLNERWQAWPWLVRTELAYADLLRCDDRVGPGQRAAGAPTATALLGRARRRAARLGLVLGPTRPGPAAP